MRNIVFFFGVNIILAFSHISIMAQSQEIEKLRDSLDRVTFLEPGTPEIDEWKILTIRTQEQWDGLGDRLASDLNRNANNIEVRIKGKNLVLPAKPKTISDLNYPNANIRIISKGATFVPDGIEFKRCMKEKVFYGEGNLKYWVVSYPNFEIDDIVVDASGNELPLREAVKEQKEEILYVEEDVWRMKIDMRDLNEDDCRDFFILLTQDWTSARHRVIMVRNGWLYFHLDSDDYHGMRDPNIDKKLYGINPRYSLINNPISDGLHITRGKIYVPWYLKKIRINKGGRLLHMADCKFNSLEFTGFTVNGSAKCPIGVYYSVFRTGLFVHHNSFGNLSNLAISAAWNENVIISDNTVNNTRVGAIECGGKNSTIVRNKLKQIGWMLNTRALIGNGDGLHICDNVIEDFNYAAIAVGSTTPNNNASKLTYIIERNEIRLSNDYTDNYFVNTLADGGGIYTGPQCTWGIIRNNVIENIKGIHSNRGIFLDDGAKNLAIYGNLIMNTGNSYDIDLRYCNTFSRDIPDHNNNNCIFQNIMTGGYRFEDGGENSNCIGGENIQLGTGPVQKTTIRLYKAIKDSKTINELNDKSVDRFVRKRLNANIIGL